MLFRFFISVHYLFIVCVVDFTPSGLRQRQIRADHYRKLKLSVLPVWSHDVPLRADHVWRSWCTSRNTLTCWIKHSSLTSDFCFRTWLQLLRLMDDQGFCDLPPLQAGEHSDTFIGRGAASLPGWRQSLPGWRQSQRVNIRLVFTCGQKSSTQNDPLLV